MKSHCSAKDFSGKIGFPEEKAVFQEAAMRQRSAMSLWLLTAWKPIDHHYGWVELSESD